MPAPIGPRPIRTITSPGRIGSSRPCPLIAAIGVALAGEDPGRAELAVDAVGVDDGRVDRRALDHRALRREVAGREGHRAGQAAVAGPVGRHDHVVGVDAVLLGAGARGAASAARWHATSRGPRPSGSPVTVRTPVVEQAEVAEVEHHLGDPAGEEGADGRVVVRAVRQDADEPGDPAVDRLPVLDRRPRRGRRRRRSPGCAAGGSSSRRRPRGRPSRCGRRRRSGRRRVGQPRARPSPTTARADRRAMSSQIGWPEGASAAWGTVRPSASATTCVVAAVPRNWQPPPGVAQARQPRSAASASESSPWT